jgi:hypothetical protein
MIGSHARGEWIARGGDPGGERRTAAGARRWERNCRIVAARVAKPGRRPAGADEGREGLPRLGRTSFRLLEGRPGVGDGLLGSGLRFGCRGGELRFGVKKPGLGPRGDERAFGPDGFPGGCGGAAGGSVAKSISTNSDSTICEYPPSSSSSSPAAPLSCAPWSSSRS